MASPQRRSSISASIAAQAHALVTQHFRLAAGLFGLTAIASCVHAVAFQRLPEVDFRYFWLAGRMWGLGLDPYSPAFATTGATLLPKGSGVYYWLYPPAWWSICTPLSLLGLQDALTVWRVIGCLAALAGTALVVSSLTEGQPRPLRAVAMAGTCALAVAIEATRNALVGGQSSLIVYFGVALLVTGRLRASKPLFVCGMVLALLKPQVGLPLLLVFATVREYRRLALTALAVTLVLAAPQWVVHGPILSLRELLSNMKQFDTLPSNTPLTLSGPAHLLARAGVTLPTRAAFGLALAGLLPAVWLLRRAPRAPDGLLLALAVIVGLAPLHNYDMTLLVIVAALLVTRAPRPAMVVITSVAMLLAFRPARIERLFDVPIYADASAGLILISCAGLLLLAGACWAAFALPPTPRAPGVS